MLARNINPQLHNAHLISLFNNEVIKLSKLLRGEIPEVKDRAVELCLHRGDDLINYV